MNCAECGQPLPEGVKFCPNCGAFPAGKAPEPAGKAAPPAATAAPPARRISTKTVIILVLSGFLVFLLAIGTAWLYFFPPWVYVRDSFRRAHPDLQPRIQQLGMSVSQGMLHVQPRPGFYTTFLYQNPASNRAIIESTVIWRKGDQDSVFGILCCATDLDDFTAYMVEGDGFYVLDRHKGGKWEHLTGFLRLPSTIKIQPNVPYKLKIVAEGQYLTLFLNDVLLLKVLDDTPHHGLTGIYAQGGKSGETLVDFDSFEARKNSIFQHD